MGGAYIADIVRFPLQADEVVDIDYRHFDELAATSIIAQTKRDKW